MKPVTEKERKYYLEKWKITRQNKWGYVIKSGILLYSLPSYTLITMYNLFLRRAEPLGGEEFFIGLVLWTMMGTLFGYWNFVINENRYKQIVEQNDANF